MRRPTVFVVAALACLAYARPVAEPQPQQLARVMQLKLDYSQAILKSIVLEDFATLERQSRELAALTETAGWGALRTPEYARHSADFMRTAEALAVASKERNAEAAALEYVGLTLKCVQCHKYLRDARRAH